MKYIYKYFKPFMLITLIAMLLIFIQSILNLYLPTLMSDIINQGIITQDVDSVLSHGLKMIAVTALAGVCTICSTFIAAKVAAGFARNLRMGVYSKIEAFSLNEFNKIQTSSLITRTTNDITQIQNLTLMMIRMLILAPMMCIGGIVMAVSKNLELSAMFTIVMPLILVIIVLFARKLIPLFTSFQKLTDKLNQVVREKITGTRVIRAFGTQEFERNRYDKANKDIYDVSLRAGYIISILMPLLLFVINVSSVAIIWFGSHLVESGSMQIGDMMAFMQYAIQVLFSMFMIVMLFIMIPRAIVSAKRINEILELEPSIKDDEKEAILNRSESTEHICFDNVSFSYNDSQESVLDNISFKVKKGETLAIIGGTGSGKTTILNLILRFYEPNSGSVLINGNNIKNIKLEELRNMIGFVPQKANLFSGSIAENIRYGKETASDDEVIQALKVAQAYDFVSKLDNGVNSEVAQGGTNFSGGQKQRLTIARAIVKQPDIYIFDDSFSALDYKTDAKLRSELKKYAKNTTTIIVAQRVSTIMNADNIILINEGKVVAQGTHKQLYANCKEYKEIVMSQITEKEAMSSGK